MEQRVEGDVLGHDVVGLVPRLLLLVARRADGLVKRCVKLLVSLGILPLGALLGPAVVAVPPVHEKVGVVAEDRRVAGGQNHVEIRIVDVGVVLVQGAGGERLQLDRHAHRLEVFDDLRRKLGDPRVVGGQERQVEVLDSGLLEELLGLLRVVLVDGRSLVVVRVGFGEEGRRRRRRAGRAEVDELLGVDGVEEGLPDLRVVEGRLLRVEHEEGQVEALDLGDLGAGGLQEVGGLGGHRLHDGDGLLLHRGHPGGVVLEDLPLHVLGLGGLGAVVIRVGGKGDVRRIDRLVRPRARADRLGGQGLVGGRGRNDFDEREAGLDQREGVVEVD